MATGQYGKPVSPDQILAIAERVCQQRGVRLTHLRRRVLEQVLKTEGVIKAYDLIHDLSSQDRRIKPPTIYRSLAFLLEQGFIHRVESLNGFVVCAHPGEAHETLLMICNHCGQITDTHAGNQLTHLLGSLADSQGFKISSQVIELRGLCSNCRILDRQIKVASGNAEPEPD